MLLGEIGELGLIERFGARLAGGSVKPCVIRGIGDDCAVVRVGEGLVQVVTTDALVEGVHFLRATTSPHDLGHKSLAVSLSDVAAMGAKPTSALVSIAAPEWCTVEYLDSFYNGMLALADRFGVSLVGGDTCASLSDLVINVVQMGTGPEHRICYRSGAAGGDAFLVAGAIGESGAGLELLSGKLRGTDALAGSIGDHLRRRHLAPTPLVDEGQWLSASGDVTAMIDVSDGLGSDAKHICAQSGVGVVIEAALLPITDELRGFLSAAELPAERFLLEAGEDYALAFTAAATRVDSLVTAFRERFDTPIAVVGQVTDNAEVLLGRSDGSSVPLPGGHEHFGTSS
jgi:thiamine-monophosphate kinase